jgi:hypothetical protein
MEIKNIIVAIQNGQVRITDHADEEAVRGCLKITYFTQFLCCQKNLILKILSVFLKVKFFFRLELEQTKQFSNSL